MGKVVLGETIKKVYLATNGCPENRNDLARMQKYLELNDWIATDKVSVADLILFNSCGLTKHSEDVSINIITDLNLKKKTSAELVVYGCLPKINAERLREVYSGITFGSDEIDKISQIIPTKTEVNGTSANYLYPNIKQIMGKKWRLLNCMTSITWKEIENRFYNILHQKYNNVMNAFSPNSFIIKVSTGCMGNCAFCAVKLSRGRVKSKTIHTIMKEFDLGIENGYDNIALIGTDLGSYGLDNKTNLVDLLKKMTARDGNYSIRLRNIHPRYLIRMMPKLKEILETGKISFMSVYAESGNNRILKLMKRGYKIEDYISVVNYIKKNHPQIVIRNQLMVGFPGETDEEFNDSLALLDILNVDMTEVYLYSPRPNTEAALLNNSVPYKVSMQRYNKLLKKSIFTHWKYKKKVIEKQKGIFKTIPSETIFPEYRKILQQQ